MGADLGIRPVGTSVAVPAVVSYTTEAAKSAVPTQLTPDQAVTTATKPQDSGSSTTQDFGHKITIDRDAGEVVYQVVDNRTSLVVSQFPDEARLRARAYLRTQDEAKQDKTQQRTDRSA